MELDSVRKELNKYDNIIKNMIVFRMSLIPIVADIKIKNDLPLFQGKREEEIYKNIENFCNEKGIAPDLVKDIYKLIIANALKIEHDIVDDSKKSIINQDSVVQNLEDINKEFEKLDNIIQKEIPEIISKISEQCEELTLNQISTLYYNNKINS